MALLNFHYLRYFWTVAREGGLRKAAERLHVSQPTISAQVKALEEQLGEKLTRRAGRGLALTDAGRRVFDYAEEIFALGDDLVQAVGRPDGTRPLRVAHRGHRLAAQAGQPRAHAPALPARRTPVQVVVSEASAADLLVQLAAHRLDLVLADEPAPSSLDLRAFNHPLGRLRRVVLRAAGAGRAPAPPLSALARRRADAAAHASAPRCAARSTTGSSARELRPRVVAEYDDGALMKIAAADGLGVLPIPTVAEREAVERYGLVRARPRDRGLPPGVLRHQRRAPAHAPGRGGDHVGGAGVAVRGVRSAPQQVAPQSSPLTAPPAPLQVPCKSSHWTPRLR